MAPKTTRKATKTTKTSKTIKVVKVSKAPPVVSRPNIFVRFAMVLLPAGILVLGLSFAASLWWSSPLVARAAEINSLAVGLNQELTTAQGVATSTILTGEDLDDDVLYFSISTPPAHGTLLCAGVPCVIDMVFGSTTGTVPFVTYTPDSGYVGTDMYDFTASDDHDTTGATPQQIANQDATITIHVVGPVVPNTAPVANAQSVLLDKNTTKDIMLSGADSDVGDTLVFATSTNPLHGSLVGSSTNLTYTPATDYVGSDSFDFTLNDGQATSTATVTITVTDVVPPPASNNTSGGGGGGGGTVLGLIGSVYVNPSNGGVGGFVLGTSTEASSTDDLPAGCSAYLTTYLRMGKNNNVDEVKKLQLFLNKQINAGLPVTGVFGSLTLQAVKKFQLSQWETVLKPWVAFGLSNDHSATGYVYKTTKHTINALNCGALQEPTPQLP